MPRLHAPAALKLDIYFAGISPGETACPQKNTIVAGLCLGWRIGRWTRERGRGGKEKKKKKSKKEGIRDMYNVTNVTLNCRSVF